MNRKTAKDLLPIIKAFSEGKCVETKTSSGWISIENMGFVGNPLQYRIKPEPKYRPFKNAKECWKEMLKHQPFGWVKCKEGYFNIVYVNDYYAGLADSDGAILLASKNSYQDHTFADGTPFGIKLEE